MQSIVGDAAVVSVVVTNPRNNHRQKDTLDVGIDVTNTITVADPIAAGYASREAAYTALSTTVDDAFDDGSYLTTLKSVASSNGNSVLNAATLSTYDNVEPSYPSFEPTPAPSKAANNELFNQTTLIVVCGVGGCFCLVFCFCLFVCIYGKETDLDDMKDQKAKDDAEFRSV
jgi:hypothetical protein